MHGLEEGCCHGHRRRYSDQEISAIKWNLTIAMGGNGILSLAERYAFFWTDSMPVNAASLHDLADWGSSLILLLIATYAQKHEWAWDWAALAGNFCVIGTSYVACMQALWRMADPHEITAQYIWILAVINLLANYAMARRLNKGLSEAEKASALHFMEDAGSAGMMLVVSLLPASPNRNVIDALLAALISSAIMFRAVYKTADVIRKMTTHKKSE